HIYILFHKTLMHYENPITPHTARLSVATPDMTNIKRKEIMISIARDCALDPTGSVPNRVEVGPRYVAHCVDHHHHNRTPNDTNARECDGPSVDFVDGHRATSREYHEICSD
ncbi:RNA-directed RNA polymerase L, partial [Striga asiatica]